MTRNKNGLFKFFNKNIASGTNQTSMMIYVDSLNVYFANMGKSMASGSNCSNLGDMIIPKSLDKTIFLYSTDPSELYSLI